MTEIDMVSAQSATLRRDAEMRCEEANAGDAEESPGDAPVDRVSSTVEGRLNVLGGVEADRALGDVVGAAGYGPQFYDGTARL